MFSTKENQMIANIEIGDIFRYKRRWGSGFSCGIYYITSVVGNCLNGTLIDCDNKRIYSNYVWEKSLLIHHMQAGTVLHYKKKPNEF